MLKANIEIDNYTAHSCSPKDFITKFILKDAELIKYSKKHNMAIYKNNYAQITFENMEQI